MLDMSNYIIFFINIHGTRLIPVAVNVYFTILGGKIK